MIGTFGSEDTEHIRHERCGKCDDREMSSSSTNAENILIDPTHPGQVLAEDGIEGVELTRNKSGVSIKETVHGKRGISADAAVRLVPRPGGVSIAVTDLGDDGPVIVLLHGLAGSSRELLPTAQALRGCRVLLVDQRGHGASTRRPDDLSRAAFVGDVVAAIEDLAPGRRVTLVGQSMGAHTAFLTAAARPDLVEGLVMLEGHVSGNDDPSEAAGLGRWFASWPVPFEDEAAAREFLGEGAIVDAWVVDLQQADDGLVPRFDAEVVQRTIEAVHEPRWDEWEALQVPTLAVFAEHGMFSDVDKDELIRRRPGTDRIDLGGGSHDAHLDAFDEWIDALRHWLSRDLSRLQRLSLS